jgi:hypothetical protein
LKEKEKEIYELNEKMKNQEININEFKSKNNLNF